jgi:two-component system, chemotaxis family, chemotaxis protein CheY
MNSIGKTVLVVDDDVKILKALEVRLKAGGFDVLTAPDGVQALSLAGSKKPDLVIADIWMPVGMGFSLAYRLKETMPEVPLIFLTASKQAGLTDMAKQVGAAGFLEKPYDPEVLLAAVYQALKLPIPVAGEKNLLPNETRGWP